jgi:hypothetical protein
MLATVEGVTQPRKERMIALCHPTRPHWARKKCRQCYSKWYHLHIEVKQGQSFLKKRAAERKLLRRSLIGVPQGGSNGHGTPKPLAQPPGIRLCKACSLPLLRWRLERQKQWELREFCSSRCETLGGAFGPGWKEMFPGARCQWVHEAPDICERGGCRGRIVDCEDGVRCISCGTRYPVVERLMATLFRGEGSL